MHIVHKIRYNTQIIVSSYLIAECHLWCRQHRELLKKCAATALSSKLVAHQKDFFANMVVDAVMMLDDLLPLNMIGVKKIQGGALEVCNCTVYAWTKLQNHALACLHSHYSGNIVAK